MDVRAFFAAAMFFVMVAGCADDKDPSPATVQDPDVFQDVEVTDATGAIRGLVVSDAIVPIAEVLIAVAGGQSATTDQQGAFVINNLQPGDYFLTAAKPGYVPTQVHATVVAGQRDPPITKILLAADAATAPFVEMQQWRAFLQCGANVVVGSANPCAFTGSDNVHDFPFGGSGVPTWMQAEAVWKGTQPTGNYLNIGWHRSGTADFKSANGASPLLLTTNQTQVIEVKGEDVELLTVRVFPGRAPDMTPTIVLNQAYDIYVLYFYNFAPREGYMFVIDGACEPPGSCQ